MKRAYIYIAERSWKINQRDRMSLLLACCKDCIKCTGTGTCPSCHGSGAQ